MAQSSKELRRYDTLTVRVSRVEKARLSVKAAEADITVSEYVRNRVLQADETDPPK